MTDHWRRREGKDTTWHHCTDCSNWPRTNYDWSYEKPTSGPFCTECLRKMGDLAAAPLMRDRWGGVMGRDT